MNYFSRIFIHGVLVLVPLIATLYIVIWLLVGFESIFKGAIEVIAPSFYFTGLGTLVGVLAIFATGILMQTWGLRSLYHYGEKTLEKFPIIGDIYGTLKSLLNYFTYSSKESSEQVVVIEVQGFKLLGIVTVEDLSSGPKEIVGSDMIAVYLPMSYQLGGYTVYVKKQQVTPIAMTKKAALQWILTAGVVAGK